MHKLIGECVMNVRVRLSKVHACFSPRARLARLCSFSSPYQVHDRIVCVGVQVGTHDARESTFRKQTVGIYVESVPCAHAVSLIVRYAKGTIAN